MSNFDKEQNSKKKITLPPPPKASKSNNNNNNINGGGDSDNKLKLKRLQQQQQHTISGGGNNIITATTTTNVDVDDVVGGVGGGNVCGKNIQQQQQQQQQQEIYSIIINPIESCSSNIDSIMTAAAAAAASTTTSSTTIDNLQQQQQQSSIMINNANNNVDNRSTITNTTTTATPPPPPTTTTMKLNQDSIFKMDDEDGVGGGASGFEIVAPKTTNVHAVDHDKMIRKHPPPGVKDGGVYFNNVDDDDDQDDDLWTMTGEQQQYYIKQFQMLQKNSNGNIQGQVAKIFFEKSGLEAKELSHIWKMSDLDEDGQLSLPEFCIAMHLVVLRRNQVMMPDKLPTPLKNYYVNFSCTLNGGVGGSGSSYLDQSSMDRNNSVEMLDLDLELDIGTEQNNVTDHHQHNRHNHHRSQSQSQRNSQPNWTRFNDDSPNALLLIKDENEHQPSSSENGSPIKLANFDYDINYIATNPNIKHPVPLRMSPTSPPLSSMEQINIDDVINAAEKCSIQSSPSSIDSFDFVNKPQPFFPVSQTTSDEILKQSLLINTQEPNDCDLFKKIFDHVKNIEHRFCRMNPIKGNLLTTSIQQENKSDSDKIEELKQIIQTTDSNRRLLLQQNYQLYQDVGGLLKIVNYLFENKIPPKNFAAAVSEKSQNNDDFAGKLAKI